MEYKADNPFEGGSEASSSSNTLSPKAQELMRREEELARRERSADQREQMPAQKAKNMPHSARAPNWPVCRPILYHDIEADMPTPQLTRLVRIAYFAWMFNVIALFYNWVALLANLIGASQDGKAIGDMILAIVYFVILSPVWFLIYRLLYRAARRRKPSLFIAWFCLYVMQLIAFAGMIVGYTGTGCGGFWRMLGAFNANSTAVGIILLVCGAVWSLCMLAGIVIFTYARIEYSRSGGLAQAKKEMTSAAAQGAANNPELVFKGAQMAAST